MLNAGTSIDLLLGVINRASDRWPLNLPFYAERWWGTSKSWASTDHQTLSKSTAEAKLGGADRMLHHLDDRMGFAMKTADRNSSSEIGDKSPSEVTRSLEGQ